MKSLEDMDIFEILEYIKRTAPKYAKAKAKRIYMEEFRKSLKALIMSEDKSQPVNAQERNAYSHPKYIAHIEAMEPAVREEEEYRWKLIAAQAAVEVWRSLSANQRAEAKVL